MKKKSKPAIKKHHRPLEVIGRDGELAAVRACFDAERNVLLEGPVGVGKTHLATFVAQETGRPVFRIDGDGRYSEQKLTGWFDPPTVVKKGFVEAAFIAGPLVEAMKKGGVLFINELNRMPEGVQNVLLPAIDERLVVVPKLGTIRAAPGFLVIATQNPKEFVATSHLSEAILDRFEWIVLDYQSESDEVEIVLASTRGAASGFRDELARAAVRLVRATRSHDRIRRGASVRAAIAVTEVAEAFIRSGMVLKDAFMGAARVALPTRIELERDSEGAKGHQEEMLDLLDGLAEDALSGATEDEKKKN